MVRKGEILFALHIRTQCYDVECYSRVIKY